MPRVLPWFAKAQGAPVAFLGHHDLQGETHVLEATRVTVVPVIDLLAERRCGASPSRNPHGGNEQLKPVEQMRNGHAGAVDEKPLAGTAVLARRRVLAWSPVSLNRRRHVT